MDAPTDMRFAPADGLASILQPAYDPCPGFDAGCKCIARWIPTAGHVPRGFIGALGSIDEVEVIILVAEPGNPHPNETYLDPSMMEAACSHTFWSIDEGTDPYHKRLKLLLDLIFPGLSLENQLRKAWVTEAYLCSAPVEGGKVLPRAEYECASRYLLQQLRLLSGRPVIALGKKAQRRARLVMPDTGDLVEAWHPSARKSNQEFQRSYQSAAEAACAIWDRTRGR